MGKMKDKEKTIYVFPESYGNIEVKAKSERGAIYKYFFLPRFLIDERRKVSHNK